MPQHSVGFVYAVSNRAIPEMVKVGFTTKPAEERARQLYSTSVPYPFDVEFRAATSHWRAVEAFAHQLLDTWRVNPRREFFAVTARDAIENVRDALLTENSIDAWRGDGNYVRHGDRIALTLVSGDLILVVTCPSLMSRPEITDVWQAHSDGGLLGLMGTNDPDHVAGLSSEDAGGEEDPVPYLDRKKKVPNGAINGRERLVPGERRIWQRPYANGMACKVALFEMRDHCQAVSRTWKPKIDSSRAPLLLNIITYDEPPEGVARVAALVPRLHQSRCWAPRNPGASEEWYQSVGDHS
ncbi:GIY-YIG nuclease family protein [Nonomuraea sp. NPDC003560]|uniref:GIY-YIG nuclease family protein n=1 Tax=Nonomuraea sp. NPDC003560 TaxID=3364341 RepID=UPI0036C4C527